MKFCESVVGNSSSGILETPAFGIPTVNIGDRQKGRVRSSSIIDCDPEISSIVSAVKKSLDPQFRQSIKELHHPCDREGTSELITQVLQSADLSCVIKKSFFDLDTL